MLHSFPTRYRIVQRGRCREGQPSVDRCGPQTRLLHIYCTVPMLSETYYAEVLSLAFVGPRTNAKRSVCLPLTLTLTVHSHLASRPSCLFEHEATRLGNRPRRWQGRPLTPLTPLLGVGLATGWKSQPRQPTACSVVRQWQLQHLRNILAQTPDASKTPRHPRHGTMAARSTDRPAISCDVAPVDDSWLGGQSCVSRQLYIGLGPPSLRFSLNRFSNSDIRPVRV